MIVLIRKLNGEASKPIWRQLIGFALCWLRKGHLGIQNIYLVILKKAGLIETSAWFFGLWLNLMKTKIRAVWLYVASWDYTVESLKASMIRGLLSSHPGVGACGNNTDALRHQFLNR
jgi:hypothetical protein